ncbi:right-handed parallel beta-helix repeat-containing protein [Streptomyces sp. NPDC008092]|uniref:right-handed parallel beta-helix repeat-containing protein n=1 Tax=Streptomyces sp. NPDC008092 TaxID=3364808 RepID=UPI0036EBFDD7
MRYTRLSSSAAVAAAVVTCVTAGPAAAGGGDDSSTPVACNTMALTTAILGASPGETLSLSRDCVYQLTAPVGATGDGLPRIDRDLTIRGNGATIVRTGNPTATFRIFEVVSGGRLRLEDLTLRGGRANGDGGGILVSAGTLRLTGVDVLQSTASGNGGGVAVSTSGTAIIRRGWVAFNNGANGGGLFNEGTLGLEDAEISRNHAQSIGGGIAQASGSTYVQATLIRRNTSAAAGGGVGIVGGTAQIDDSKIANNTTGSLGGGIANTVQLTLEKTEVSGNVAAAPGGDGGGIYNATASGVLVLKGSNVLGNSANGPTTGTDSAQGGGIYNDGGPVTLDHSNVRNNSATVAPGGVFTNRTFTVTDSAITRNNPTNCAGSPTVVTGCTN